VNVSSFDLKSGFVRVAETATSVSRMLAFILFCFFSLGCIDSFLLDRDRFV
jgi:hypothetical protein